MRRFRKQRSPLEVSLFPFLAVLICTLGVLIVLLVLAVKAADNNASEIADQQQLEHQQRLEVLQSELAMEELRVKGLQSIRPDSTGRLSEMRTLRGHLEDEIRKLDQKSRRMTAQMDELVRQKIDRENGRVRREQEAQDAELEIADVRAQIERTQSSLDQELADARKTGPVRYSIVPHSGHGGTNRRPIYIECSGRGLEIQPYGIVLDGDDLVEPFPPGNPLDAALLAVREYWQRYELDGMSEGSEGKPYPLLVVRPDGAHSYTAARLAMRSWDEEFGYELIEAGRFLDFGPTDDNLSAEIRTAIEQAKVRQEFAVASARNGSSGRFFGDRRNGRISSGDTGSGGYGSGGRSGLIVNSSGGFVTTDGSAPASPTNNSSPRSSFANRAANATSTGNRDQQVMTAGFPTNSNGPQSSELASAESGSLSGSPGVDGNMSGQLPKFSDEEPPHNAYPSSAPDADAPASNAPVSDAACIADSRGEQWALPSRTPGATAYLRPVRVSCDANTLTIRSVGHDDIVIPFNGETSTAINPLVESVWQMIDSWGPAGNRAYWKPEIRVSVLSGGRQRVADLTQLLNRSGMVLKQEQR